MNSKVLLAAVAVLALPAAANAQSLLDVALCGRGMRLGGRTIRLALVD